MNISLEGFAIGYGILTVENYNQALVRSKTIANKSIGNEKDPIIILPPQEKGGIFDIIFNNINSGTNTIINMTYPKPLYKMMFWGDNYDKSRYN